MAKVIPQSEWRQFFPDFVDENQGRKAMIDIGDKHIGGGEDEEAYVFTGIESGVMAQDDDTVVVELADMEGDEQRHVTHRFEDVSELRVNDDQGTVESVEIETKGGTRAKLHLGEEVPVLE